MKHKAQVVLDNRYYLPLVLLGFSTLFILCFHYIPVLLSLPGRFGSHSCTTANCQTTKVTEL